MSWSLPEKLESVSSKARSPFLRKDEGARAAWVFPTAQEPQAL